MAPDSPVSKSYSEIVKKLKAHFKPTPMNVLTHRYTFQASIHVMAIEGNHKAVEELTSKYAEVFQEELDTMKGIRVYI